MHPSPGRPTDAGTSNPIPDRLLPSPYLSAGHRRNDLSRLENSKSKRQRVETVPLAGINRSKTQNSVQ
jgi:hypothetical protein